LVPSVGSKDLANPLESGASLAVSCLMAISSLEAMVAATSLKHSTSHS
jgi:hypothetical protein